MGKQSTAAGWIAGALRVPADGWKVISRDVLGRGGLHTMEKAELFMRRNFSNFERRSGVWRDIKSGKYGDFDVGHKRARATNPQHAHTVDNHVFERRSHNRSHQAGDMPNSYWKGEADFFNAAKAKAVAVRGLQAGAVGAAYGAVFEIPFAAADAYLDVRQGGDGKQAAKKCAKKVGFAAAGGGLAGVGGWALAAACPPLAPIVGAPLAVVGVIGLAQRTHHLYQRFITPPWEHDLQLATANHPAQFALFTFTGTGVPSISSPSSASDTTRCARFKP